LRLAESIEQKNTGVVMYPKILFRSLLSMNVAYIETNRIETNRIRIRKKKRERLRDVVSLITVLALVISLIFNFILMGKIRIPRLHSIIWRFHS
jgi:hypothetical protein